MVSLPYTSFICPKCEYWHPQKSVLSPSNAGVQLSLVLLWCFSYVVRCLCGVVAWFLLWWAPSTPHFTAPHTLWCWHFYYQALLKPEFIFLFHMNVVAPPSGWHYDYNCMLALQKYRNHAASLTQFSIVKVFTFESLHLILMVLIEGQECTTCEWQYLWQTAQ